MKCSRHEMSVFLHAHGQLQGIRRLLLESHLENCDTCRARWARWAVEKDKLRRALAPLPILDRRGRVMMDGVGAGIRLERPARGEAAAGQTIKRRLVLVVLAAALALCASALAAYWQPVACHLGGAITAPPNPEASRPDPSCVTCHPSQSAHHPGTPGAAPKLASPQKPPSVVKPGH